jgi:photosystem II stability/assembly factor-like uncharacterized protein
VTCIDGLKLGGLYTIWFNDPNTGFTAGSNGIIYKTIDAGNTWTETETDRPTHRYFYTLYFFNPSVGFAGSNAELFRTTDGGGMWRNVLTDITTPLFSGGIESIYFVDINYGWFVTNMGQIWKTIDGGVTWSLCFNEADNDLTGVWFADHLYGVVTGGKGTVLRTSNGGATWTLVNSNVSTEHFYAMHAFDLQNLIVAAGEKVFRSADGGVTWTDVALPPSSYYNFYNIMFINKNIGWVNGQWGMIMKTTDGGATWVAQTTNFMETVYSVYFVDENNGWASGNYASILHTTSGGISGTGEIPPVTASGFQLNQNYPNPFDNTTTLTYSLPRSSPVKIEIYNILGSKIRTLIDKFEEPGRHQLKFDGTGLTAGIYICRFTWGTSASTAIRLLKN